MFGFEPTNYDKKVYKEELQSFLPDKIVDVHTHIWKNEFCREDDFANKGCVSWTELVARDCTIEDLISSYEAMFEGKKIIPVLMGQPTAILDKTNEYVKECAGKYKLKSLFCTSYDTSVKDIKNALLKDGFCGIKPYLSNTPLYIPDNEIRIYDFLPHEHLEILNNIGGIVMLHIPRPERLKDPVNLEHMMQIEAKYKNVKLIIAHIGRAYSPEDIGTAFETLKHTKNMMFDFTANTLSEAMTECIKAVGIKRFMFGSDMPITKMRMYRINEKGIYYNIIPRGIYGDISDDTHMRETDETDITTFMYEEIRSFKRTAKQLHLTKEDVYNVFYRNAADLFSIK